MTQKIFFKVLFSEQLTKCSRKLCFYKEEKNTKTHRAYDTFLSGSYINEILKRYPTVDNAYFNDKNSRENN